VAAALQRRKDPRGAGPQEAAQELPWQLLREAFFLLRERWTQQLERFDLSVSDFVVLELCAPRPAKTSEIARRIGITAAGTTDVIDRLEARHLVRRAADPQDRRVVLVQLAPAGRCLYQEAKFTQREAHRFLDDAMNREERRALAKGLSALTAALHDDSHQRGGGG